MFQKSEYFHLLSPKAHCSIFTINLKVGKLKETKVSLVLMLFFLKLILNLFSGHGHFTTQKLISYSKALH